MRFFNTLRRAAVALGIAATAGACSSAATSTAPQGGPSPRPALWQVADHDTTIYLFGTIHLLPDQYRWRTAKFDDAVNRSGGLVVETIIDPANPAPLAQAMAQLGLSPNLPPLASRVPADKRPALEAAIRTSGFPAAVFDRMETWAAAVTLLGTQFKSLGLQGEDGVETTLRNSFKGSGKPIGQLESNAEQLGFFDRLPEDAQRGLLLSALDNPAGTRQQFDAMLASWARGDVNAIARSFNEEMASSPPLKDALLTQRNRNWAGWIERRMAQPGTVLVAVGAGHLAGSGSVLDLLQQRGLKVTRVQ